MSNILRLKGQIEAATVKLARLKRHGRTLPETITKVEAHIEELRKKLQEKVEAPLTKGKF